MKTQPCPLLMRAYRATLAILSLGAWVARAASTSTDQNWPQWRGPFANGVAPHGNPPLTWSETNNVKWKVRIPGSGSASPIVWENLVFLQTAIATGKKVQPPAEKSPVAADAPTQNPQGSPRGGGMMRPEKPSEFYQFVLLCLDRQTGKTLWQKVAREEVPHEGHRANDGSFASASPVTDGKHVFAYFGSRGLHCYDRQGNLEWEKDFGRMQTKMSFGEGSSPTLFGSTIVINWDHDEKFDASPAVVDRELFLRGHEYLYCVTGK